MQTAHFINVEYENIDRVIKHKFDVIDDSILSYNKIIIGIDLLPKFSIHSMNVAVKYKSTEKEKEDSIVDKAYKPNIFRAGTDKEQKAFSLDIKPYKVANQQLNKNSLCNITKESFVGFVCVYIVISSSLLFRRDFLHNILV